MSTEARDVRTGGRAPEGASPDVIESTLSSNREALDHTLTELQERLSAEGLMHMATERLRSESGMQFMRGLRDTVVHNPMPVTVIALGMAWAAMSERTGESAQRTTGGPTTRESDTQIGSEADERSGESKGSRLQGARGRARDFMGRGRTGLSRAGGSAAARSRDSASRGWEFTREHPVLMAGAGIAFGAALAALLPTTRMEREQVGPVRDEALRGSTRFASEAGRGAATGFEAQERPTTTPTGMGDRAPERTAPQGATGRTGERPAEGIEGEEPYSATQTDAGDRDAAERERRPS